MIGEGFDTLIWAIGREPNIKDLDLDKAGIEVTKEGHIKVRKTQDKELTKV